MTHINTAEMYLSCRGMGGEEIAGQRDEVSWFHRCFRTMPCEKKRFWRARDRWCGWGSIGGLLLVALGAATFRSNRRSRLWNNCCATERFSLGGAELRCVRS